MKYICEVCNKAYNTEGKALECEKEHEKKTKEQAMCKDYEASITDAVNTFIKRYKRMPNVAVTDENIWVLAREIENLFDDLFKDENKAEHRQHGHIGNCGNAR